LAELDWSLVALTLVQLFAIKEQVKLDEPPDNMSVASALKAIRHAMNNWNEPAQAHTRMDRKLQKATKDTYNRASDKDPRYKPKFKDKPSTTKPIVKQATEKQQQRYDRLFLAT